MIFVKNFDFDNFFLLSTKISIFIKKFDFRQKFRFWQFFFIFDKNFDFDNFFLFSRKISIFEKIVRFSPKLFIFDKNFDFRQNFLFSTKISIFDKIFYFRQKFRFSPKLFIFDKNFDFRQHFLFSTKISIFDNIFYFRQKFRFSIKLFIFVKKKSVGKVKPVNDAASARWSCVILSTTFWPRSVKRFLTFGPRAKGQQRRRFVNAVWHPFAITAKGRYSKSVGGGWMDTLYAGLEKLTPFFRSGQNLTTKIIFSNDELHIILKRGNLEIGEHSSFLHYWTKKVFKGTLKIRFIDISKVDFGRFKTQFWK